MSLLTIALVVGLLGAIVGSLVLFPRKRKEIALVLSSGFIALCVAEASLRLFYPRVIGHDQLFEDDRVLGWRFVPNRTGWSALPSEAPHDVRINSLGFRDDPPPPSDRAVHKIMVAGDSFVSNLSVRDDEVFTEVMQERLPNTAVLNIGVNGYSTVQQYLLLQQTIDEINPDVVLLVVYVRNDFDENTGTGWLYPKPTAAWNAERSTIELRPIPSGRTDSIVHAARQLNLYRLIRGGLARLTRETHMQFEPTVYRPQELYLCRKELLPETQTRYRILQEMLLKIQQLVAERHKRMVFIVAPSIVQVDSEEMSWLIRQHGVKESDYSYSLANDRLMSFAKENGLHMLDLLPTLRAASASGRTLYHREERHWNREGNRVVAETIVEYLKSASIVP